MHADNDDDNSAESEERVCFRADMDAKGRLQKRLKQSGQTKSTYRCCPLSAQQSSSKSKPTSGSKKTKMADKSDNKQDQIYHHLKKSLFSKSLATKGQEIKGKRSKNKVEEDDEEDDADSKELGSWKKVSHDKHPHSRQSSKRKLHQKETKSTGFDFSKYLLW